MNMVDENMDSATKKEIVQGAVTGSRILLTLKENRIEVIGILILAHLLGVSDRILAQVSGMCMI